MNKPLVCLKESNFMAEKPILFNGEMVNAILEGRKSQTRRVIKPQPMAMSGGWWHGDLFYVSDCLMQSHLFHDVYGDRGSPYGSVYSDGTTDTIWVRETWRAEELGDDSHNPGLDGIRYRADNAFIEIENTQEASYKWMDARGNHGDSWRPSIFMPRWASRITLDIVDVRVERVQEISTENALAEGLMKNDRYMPRVEFAELWDNINGQRGYGWDVNPWVWVVEFKLAHTASLTTGAPDCLPARVLASDGNMGKQRVA
jgi:hypothetical protein